MTVKLTGNFLNSARGMILKDSASVTWSIDQSTNEITATATGSGGDDITTGEFTLTPTGGMSFSPSTVTATWTLQGDFVELIIPGIIGTSNADTFTLTGSIPSQLVPATTKWLAVAPMEDNGTFAASQTEAKVSAGVITFGIAGSSANWTATGSKGVSSPLCLVYSVN